MCNVAEGYQCACREGECAVNGECVPPGGCPSNTGGSCNDGCDTWRDGTCSRRGDRCVCNQETQCARLGQCMPKPDKIPPRESKTPDFGGSLWDPIHGYDREPTALVLSGGGAKGAFELGVLQGICGRSELEKYRGWDMILGTSIGAMGAGMLAQYPKEVQCSMGVQAMARFWETIRVPQDVFASSQLGTRWKWLAWLKGSRGDCFSWQSVLSDAQAFEEKGGLCDPEPGRDLFRFEMNKTALRQSGVGLRVVATCLNTGLLKWWTENDESILDGCLASGAIAPLIYPKKVDGSWYVDGGLGHNTPLLKAVQEGAKRVFVILLDPSQPVTTQMVEDMPPDDRGMLIVEFMTLWMYARSVDVEIGLACDRSVYPGVTIHAYIPSKAPGGLADFEASKIENIRMFGYNSTAHPPVDLCRWYHRNREANGKCANGQHGPKCKSDEDCLHRVNCKRCAKSGFCTNVPLAGTQLSALDDEQVEPAHNSGFHGSVIELWTSVFVAWTVVVSIAAGFVGWVVGHGGVCPRRGTVSALLGHRDRSARLVEPLLRSGVA